MPKTPTNSIVVGMGGTRVQTAPVKRLRRRTIVIAGVVCASLLFATGVAVSHIRARMKPTIENSERLLARGQPREAKALLEKMKRPAGGSSRELLHKGRVLYSLLLEQMREERWGSYGVDPDNWLSHPLAEEAEKSFLEAKELAPDDPEIRLVLGNLYREQGRFADAETMIRSALEINEENADAFLALGLLYAEGKRLPAAEKALFYAWELDEGNPKIAKNIGFFYRFYMDVPESSIVWFSRYLDANPRRDLDINIVRAEMRSLLERYPEFAEYRRDTEPALANRGVGRTFTPKRRR